MKMNHKTVILLVSLFALFFPPHSIGEDIEYDFTFVRLKYSGSNRYKSLWHQDYPTAERNLLFQLRQHTDIKASPIEKVIEVGSPELFDYPFSYMSELGRLNLLKEDAANLREYMLRGGFIMLDDFHGTAQWKRFYKQFKKIFPNRKPRDIPISHPILNVSLRSNH